jgi:hypothetical protein
MDNGLQVASCDFTESNRLNLAVAAATIDVGDLVYLTAAGLWAPAISIVWVANVPASIVRKDAVGIAVERANAGQALRPVKRAHISGYSGLTMGGRVYMDSLVYGYFTQTKPYPVYVQQDVGFALSNTDILFDIDPTKARATIDDYPIDSVLHTGYGTSSLAAGLLCGVNSVGAIAACNGSTTTALPAVGVLASGISTTAMGSLQIKGISVSGLLAGQSAYIGIVAGGISTTAQTTAGFISQPVGYGLSDTRAIIKPNFTEAAIVS